MLWAIVRQDLTQVLAYKILLKMVRKKPRSSQDPKLITKSAI